MTFRERFDVQLSLTREGKMFVVPAGNVRACSLSLQRSGFVASVEFVLRDDATLGGSFKDELAPVFLTSEELSVALSLVPSRPTPEASGEQAPLAVKGLVTRRELEEVWTDWSADKPLFFRTYRIEFTDPASARWSKHFPVALYTKKTLLAALQEHTASAFELTSSWSVATTERPQLFLNLQRERGVSLHAFVDWYTDQYGGCVVYDYTTNKYTLAADESSTATAAASFGDDVAKARFVLRERDLAQPRILNSYAPSPATVSPQAEGVVSGLQSDYLIRNAVLADQSERELRESGRRELGGTEVELTMGAFSNAVAAPGAKLSCKAGQRFGKGSLLLAGDLRVNRLTLLAATAGALDAGALDVGALDVEYGNTSVTLEVDLVLGLKFDSDVEPPRRRTATPTYPGLVEGLVVSEKGAQTDTTWDMKLAEQTQVQEVVVNLPIFSQSVSVPFEPTFDSFNTFRPRGRGERVLVALDLHESRIARTLSFRPEAVLQSDVCGEQMVFGKTSKSITKLSHQYSGEVPIFDVTRVHDSDRIQMTFSEGKVSISVAEEGG